MKRLKLTRVIASTLVVASVLMLKPMGVNADTYDEYMAGYKVDNNNHQIRFLKQDGTYSRNEWIHKVGYTLTWGNYNYWNYFGDDYLRKEGWFNIDGNWYYERPYYYGNDDCLGGISTNEEIDGYFLGSDGAMIKNSWGTDINGHWYYAGSDGRILKNTITPDGYKVDENGRWTKNISVDDAKKLLKKQFSDIEEYETLKSGGEIRKNDPLTWPYDSIILSMNDFYSLTKSNEDLYYFRTSVFDNYIVGKESGKIYYYCSGHRIFTLESYDLSGNKVNSWGKTDYIYGSFYWK